MNILCEQLELDLFSAPPAQEVKKTSDLSPSVTNPILDTLQKVSDKNSPADQFLISLFSDLKNVNRVLDYQHLNPRFGLWFENQRKELAVLQQPKELVDEFIYASWKQNLLWMSKDSKIWEATNVDPKIEEEINLNLYSAAEKLDKPDKYTIPAAQWLNSLEERSEEEKAFLKILSDPVVSLVTLMEAPSGTPLTDTKTFEKEVSDYLKEPVKIPLDEEGEKLFQEYVNNYVLSHIPSNLSFHLRSLDVMKNIDTIYEDFLMKERQSEISFNRHWAELERNEKKAQTAKAVEEEKLCIDWIKLKVKEVKFAGSDELIKAIETPGVYQRLNEKEPYYYGSFAKLAGFYVLRAQLLKKNKALDAKGDELLKEAVTISVLSKIAFDINRLRIQPPLLSVDMLNKTSDIEREKVEAFFSYRDTLQYNKDGSLKLMDFGEDLNNTRKGRTSSRGHNAQTFLNENRDEISKRLATEPLDKVWPKESILNLYKDNPNAAAFLWLAREEYQGRRPAKNTGKYLRYIRGASSAIELHRAIVNKDMSYEAQTEFFDQAYKIKDKYKIFSAIDPKYWSFMSSNSIDTIQSTKDCMRWNGYSLTDGTDIESYQFCTRLPSAESPDDNILGAVNEKGRKMFFSIAVGNTFEEFKENINKQLAINLRDRFEEKSGLKAVASVKPEKTIKFTGYGNRATHTYEIYGKQGSIEFQLTDKIEFESDEAFWNYIADHREELESRYKTFRGEYSKSEKDWRSDSPIRDRVGPDYREGKDATPEMFQNTFGFRGVEFGNWVKQGKNGRERQWMLNNAYDALYDLSKILNVPTKALALDGDLGLCFGSRGFGSASAHYEPQNRVINLTKTKGYSSLAHEWFHALDHYMGKKIYEEKIDESKFYSDKVDSRLEFKLTESGKEKLEKAAEGVFRLPKSAVPIAEYLFRTNSSVREFGQKLAAGKINEFDLEVVNKGSDRLSKKIITVSLNKDDLIAKERGDSEKIRPEVHHAWAQTIDAIQASAMNKRMQKKNEYWRSKIEEAARSFEGFIETRSQELGIRNDFLTNGAYSAKALDKNSFYPYLDGEDVRIVGDKFKALFESMKTKETDKGVALYSKAVIQKTGSTRSDIRDAIANAIGEKGLKELVDSGAFILARTENEARQFCLANRKIPLTAEKEGLTGNQKGNPLGFYDPSSQKSYLVAEYLTKETAVPVLLHEVGVHMAHDVLCRNSTQKIVESANNLYETGLKQDDPLMKKVEFRLKESGISRAEPSYREEVCGYLVEEAAKAQQLKPAVLRWFSEVKSLANVWLVEHGVRDTSKLTAFDHATIARANLKEIARRPAEITLSEDGKKILAEHVKSMLPKFASKEAFDKEIKSLYSNFVELERAGRPLPKPSEVGKTIKRDGLER